MKNKEKFYKRIKLALMLGYCLAAAVFMCLFIWGMYKIVEFICIIVAFYFL